MISQGTRPFKSNGVPNRHAVGSIEVEAAASTNLAASSRAHTHRREVGFVNALEGAHVSPCPISLKHLVHGFPDKICRRLVCLPNIETSPSVVEDRTIA